MSVVFQVGATSIGLLDPGSETKNVSSKGNFDGFLSTFWVYILCLSIRVANPIWGWDLLICCVNLSLLIYSD